MAKKTYVMDTNVLLHDPDAVLKFKDSDVVIPLAVLEELDGMKRNTDERGKNARQVIRFLNSLKTQNLHKGVDLKWGIRLLVHDLAGYESERKTLPFPLDKNHHKLVAAYQLQEKNPDVVFLSKDIVMRIKADAVGIASQDYENLKFSYDNLYRGYRKIEVPKTEIDLFFKDGFLPLEINDLRPNEYCFLFSPERSSAVGKYNSETKRLEPLMKLTRDVWGILPLNLEQKCALDLLLRDDIKLVTLVGQAGTGKTLMALACALRKVFDEGIYSRILVSRPIIPLGKDIGYLPGTKEEKLYHWMQPLYDNLEFLCSSSSGEGNGGETKTWIMESNKLEVEAVTYIRGRTLPKMFIIVDEAQNLTPHEVKTIISRAGHGTKVVLTGDPTQIDNTYLDKDSNALTYTIGKFCDQKIYGNMFLEKTERSELAAIAAEIL